MDSPNLVLVGCSATKHEGPCAAADLFAGTGFVKARAYAEQSGLPWLILSAKWGVLDPTDVISTYHVYLPEQAPSYRQAWGAWAVEQLLRAYPAGQLTVEIHASAAYVEPLRIPARRVGIGLVEPLTGLRQGERLAWYSASEVGPSTGHIPVVSRELTSVRSVPPPATTDELAAYVNFLSDPSNARSHADIVASAGRGLRDPGLYSWWVDAAGAEELSSGLGITLTAGLIYLGQAGATRWPSGKRSNNTLWGRLTTMHFGSNRNLSTLRKTLASILAEAHQTRVSEAELTRWMVAHLRIAPIVFEDRDRLGPFEQDVLGRLDPPLNLQHCPPTPGRRRLSQLRSSGS